MIMRGGLRLLAILLFKMVFGVSGPIALSTNPIEKPPTIRGPDTCISQKRDMVSKNNVPKLSSGHVEQLYVL